VIRSDLHLRLLLEGQGQGQCAALALDLGFHAVLALLVGRETPPPLLA
jgi:hypothetical protein